MASSAAADGVTKHRACDECRSRKLACSKEPDGCARCKREGIICYYSPQKQMGRPRKRRHVDASDDTGLPAPTTAQQPEHPFLFLQPADDIPLEQINHTEPTGDFHQDLSFLNEPVPTNIDTWDFVPSYDILPFDPQILEHDGLLADNANLPSLNLSGVDLLGTIDFGETDIPQETVSKDLSNTLQQYLADQIESPELESNQTSDKSTTPNSNDNGTSVESRGDVISTSTLSMRSVPTVPCGCLSSLYLALESLGGLPNEVIPAMKVARNASKVAYDVIKCTVCSASLLDPEKPPPIQSFQNLMLLGALVPSACNAYARILEMVDEETALAKQEGRTFWFTFKEIGGLWGCIGNTPKGCTAYQSYNNKTMPPDMWRLTIRGLLRLDVYGLDENGQEEIPGAKPYRQLGLKDVVGQLEERSKLRHDALDALHASGNTHEASCGVIYPSKPCSPAERNCTKILETARLALENLVIA